MKVTEQQNSSAAEHLRGHAGGRGRSSVEGGPISRSRNIFCFAALLMCGSALLTACSRDEVSGPPELRLGRDMCGECGMLINEDRCSSAFLVENRTGRARRDYIMFDDISCMIDYEDKDHDFRVIEAYVRDYSARKWVTAEAAWFLLADTDRLRTPMGSGMVAFAARSAAEERQQEVDGEIMTYEELAAARREWMAGR